VGSEVNILASKNQHYVPRVYLKSWETSVRTKAEPHKRFSGVYTFDKSDLSVGEGRTRETILSTNHTYTIKFDNSFFFHKCPDIIEDFANSILSILNDRNEFAQYNGQTLLTDRDVVKNYSKIDEWDFFHSTDGSPASRRSTSNSMQSIRCYVLEDGFSKFIESKWEKVFNSFIAPAEQLSLNGRGSVDYLFNQNSVVEQIVEMFVIMALRNPEFDLMGIFPAISKLLLSVFDDQKYTNEMLRALWLSQIYKALFGEKNSYFYLAVKETIKRCGCILFKINNCEESTFITSDNPAFTFRSSVMATNKNGMYFPLSPRYLLFMGLNSTGAINNIIIRTINKEDIKKVNQIILNAATKSIISSQRYLGSIL
jgi:hypothetical protein